MEMGFKILLLAKYSFDLPGKLYRQNAVFGKLMMIRLKYYIRVLYMKKSFQNNLVVSCRLSQFSVTLRRPLKTDLKVSIKRCWKIKSL